MLSHLALLVCRRRARANVRRSAEEGAPTEAGSGLRGLADRVAANRGRLDIRSPVGGGRRIVARLPLSAEVQIELKSKRSNWRSARLD